MAAKPIDIAIASQDGPANSTPRFATTAAISFASLDHLITQVSWIRYAPDKPASH